MTSTTTNQTILTDKLPREIDTGILEIGHLQIPCGVLEDERRIISHTGLFRAFGQEQHGKSAVEKVQPQVPRFLAAKNLIPFVSEDLRSSLSHSIPYVPKGGGCIGYGYPATILPEIAWLYLEAREADALRSTQLPAAEAAKGLARAFAKVGIEALVDEATGHRPQPAAYATTLNENLPPRPVAPALDAKRPPARGKRPPVPADLLAQWTREVQHWLIRVRRANYITLDQVIEDVGLPPGLTPQAARARLATILREASWRPREPRTTPILFVYSDADGQLLYENGALSWEMLGIVVELFLARYVIKADQPLIDEEDLFARFTDWAVRQERPAATDILVSILKDTGVQQDPVTKRWHCEVTYTGRAAWTRPPRQETRARVVAAALSPPTALPWHLLIGEEERQTDPAPLGGNWASLLGELVH